MASFLDLYEPLDIIGNGSFGIIRKVRRKSDGIILARKELNFERMSERDRKQIVAEVNILKDLNHEHIVRYHDRHVDRDAGVLYILMEYCGGGDLSSVIKLAQRHNRPIPEETIWNYFMQILLALQHCHYPNGHARSGSSGSDCDGRERRAPILHRDLKPDNVFLDESNTVKLGDFGLSKALTQASLANTYVGTPYYMSPELMQEKAYDSKSDIWSLGCLIYELCALKPPFHEAKTHSELSMFIRNGRIPPLPRGYSQALSGVIKAMLNLNPAMRPSAAQLLQHERLDLAYQVAKAQALLTSVKAHKAALLDKEREVLAREANVATREATLVTVASQKDSEIAALHAHVAEMQASVGTQIQQAITRREDELRTAVLCREEEVAQAMQKREEEIMDAVRRREAEIEEAWRKREVEIREECERELEERWKEEWEQLESARKELQESLSKLEANTAPTSKKEKSPFEEVQNIIAAQLADDQPTPRVGLRRAFTAYETPRNRPAKHFQPPASVMKGVVNTNTGEVIATPTPGDLAKFFEDTPKRGLGFAQIFAPERLQEADSEDEHDSEHENRAPPPPPSPSKRKGVPMPKSASTGTVSLAQDKPAPSTRLRRPSIRPSASRPKLPESTESAPTASSSKSTGKQPASGTSVPSSVSDSSVAPSGTTAGRPQTTRSASSPAPPVYDLNDEMNLPSPFLKKVERDRPPPASSNNAGAPRSKRTSAANQDLLRTALTGRAKTASAVGAMKASNSTMKTSAAPRRGEEARKALLRT
ncbi:kinase-like domain-containing protein [Amylostereum chailletii]|nr:kinase-like domain-containing protein [Amylostereum chailletii]